VNEVCTCDQDEGLERDPDDFGGEHDQFVEDQNDSNYQPEGDDSE